MFRRSLSSFLLVSALFGGALALQTTTASAAPERSMYIVVFSRGANAIAEAKQMRTQGFEVRHTYENVFSGVAVELSPDAARALARNPRVQSIEPDGVVTASATQTGVTWGLDRIDERTRLLSTSFTYPDSAGAGVTAYIVDTGVFSGHSEFAGRMKPGVSFVADNLGTEDCTGHGTHVAGTVAGTTYGVAKAAWITPVRVLDCSGSGSWSAVIAGLDWIGKNVAKPAVVNMSLGGGGNTSLDTAVRNLHAQGVTVVVAAGNESKSACNYSPARVTEAVTVGATTSLDARASYSNFGSCLDIFAPGSGVQSAYPPDETAEIPDNSRTAILSGTSMASPHVAGAAALLLGENPALTQVQVRDQLVSNATLGVVTSPGSGSPNRLLHVLVPGAPVSITTSSLPSGTQYSAYPSTQLTASGGDGVTYSWSANGLPTGLSLSGNVISGTPSVSGTFTIGLTVSSGSSTTSTSLPMTISPGVVVAAPGTFSKSTPLNKATGQALKPTLTWTASANASSYEVCLSTSSTCTSWISVGNVTSVVWSTTLNRNTTYYWQVRAVNSAGSRVASNGTWYFRTIR